MGFRGIGFAVAYEGSPERLDERLQVIADEGFTYAEVGAHPRAAWINGRTQARQLTRFVDVLDKHRDRLSYTFHGPMEINLFDLADFEAHERLLRSAVDVAAEIGAEIYVYHPGSRMIGASADRATMWDLMAREREVIASVADRIGPSGGKIAIEAMAWINDQGYTYAVWPQALVDQVSQIAHEAVGICLDFGHVWAASRWYGFDFVEGVRTLAPRTIHTHVQDQSGVRTSDATFSYGLGRGDLHLPPGWGELPFEPALDGTSFPQNPAFLVETRPEYLEFLTDIYEECRRLTAIVEPAAAPA